MNRPPFRVLILQTSGLTDLLHSLMALKAAKQLYPELEIDLVVDEPNVGLARSIPWIHDVVGFDTDRFSQPHAISELATWIAPLVDEPWGLLINWSYTDSSSFLSTLIPAHIKLGYSRRKDGTISCDDGWSTYVQGVIQSDIAQSVHLTDIFTTQLLTALQIHVGDAREAGNVSVTSKEFFVLPDSAETAAVELLASPGKWVALQLSSPERSESGSTPEKMALFAKQVLKSRPNHRIVLVGDACAEEEESRFFERLLETEPNDALASRVVSAIGSSDALSRAAVLSRCHWAVTHALDWAQFAAVLGVRVLHETRASDSIRTVGPYGNGHYVHESEDLNAESLFESWVYADSEWSHQRRVPLTSADAKVSRSRIRSAEDGGGVVYEGLETSPLSTKEWFSLCLGDMARAWFCGWVPEPAKEIHKSQLSVPLMRDLRQMRESLVVLKQVYEEAIRTSDGLSIRASKLKSSRLMTLDDRDEVQKFGLKLQELDGLAARLANVHPQFQVFVNMGLVMMHNLSGERLSELGEEAAKSYRQLLEGAQVLSAWIDRCAEISKPEAVSESGRRAHLRLIK